ncbi:MAG: asparagine synthase (glutamine-hydrolyzing), partial [Acidimicrobiia bacterium]
MCGIVGALNLSTDRPIDLSLLEAANKRLLHRGPDESGTYAAEGVAMAMRRLSVVDIPGGTQPMSNEDGSVHLVYNGETYNHIQLQAELESRGHLFRSRSDTEAVVHAYEEWGAPGFLQRMRGQAGLALWDEKQRQLVLARDRFGIKPLYYMVAGGRLVFASEVRPLLELGGVQASLNLEALGELLSVAFVSGSRSLFAGVSKLPAGHYLTVRDGVIRERRYWGIDEVETREESLEQAAEGFAEKLAEAVEIRMEAEVPLGALLSGGIDSGAVVALANSASEGALSTVSIGFPEDVFDESDRAQAMAEFAETDHHAFSFPHLGMDRYPEVLRGLEEPIVSTAFMSGHFIMEKVREAGLTVVLGGDGADEMLGGYQWHHWDRIARPLSKLPHPVRRLIVGLPSLARAGRTRMGLAATLGARGVGT